MLQWICFCIVLLTAKPAWPQVGYVLYEASPAPTNDDQMLTPPPVSGQSFPTSVGSQTRSNYIGVGVLLNAAYFDNVLGEDGYTTTGDTIYSILPSVSFDKSTVRQHLSLGYSPGFTSYQHVRALDQAASIGFQYRLGEYTNLNLNDSFRKTSNVFDQLYSPTGVSVSGSMLTPPTPVVVPYANFLTNSASAGFSHQISGDAMIGANGIAVDNRYLNADQASSFYNSSSRGGIAFYNRRLSGQRYIGVTYEYVRTLSDPSNPHEGSAAAEVTVQTRTPRLFYTVYLRPTLLVSLSAGPQHFDVSQSLGALTASWTPSVEASVDWQGGHGNFAASYSRTVSGSSGLPGAFASSKLNASWSWQMARTWTATLEGIYFADKNVAQSLFTSNSGGHSISANLSMQHTLGGHMATEIGYTHLHQIYRDIAVISETPDSDRVYVSISYQLTRSLGR